MCYMLGDEGWMEGGCFVLIKSCLNHSNIMKKGKDEEGAIIKMKPTN